MRLAWRARGVGPAMMSIVAAVDEIIRLRRRGLWLEYATLG
jgi:hypothetical protein